jgi:hypothetical protein
MASNIYQPSVPIVESPEDRNKRIDGIITNIRSEVTSKNTPAKRTEYLNDRGLPKELHSIFLSETDVTPAEKLKISNWERDLPSGSPFRQFTPMKSAYQFKVPEEQLRVKGITTEQFNAMKLEDQLNILLELQTRRN